MDSLWPMDYAFTMACAGIGRSRTEQRSTHAYERLCDDRLCDELLCDDRLRDVRLDGTFAPFFRASESPMAIACLRLVTLPP